MTFFSIQTCKYFAGVFLCLRFFKHLIFSTWRTASFSVLQASS